MSPKEAIYLKNKIRGLFKHTPPAPNLGVFMPASQIPPVELPESECEWLQIMLEKYPLSTAEAVTDKYARETNIFDRVKFYRLLGDEHARRTPTPSLTPKWRAESKADEKADEDKLKRMPKWQLQESIQEAQKRYPATFGLMRSDPMQTPIGRALIVRASQSQKNTA